MSDYSHLIGQRCLTTWEPRGVVVVQEITPGYTLSEPFARGYFERDHCGYAAGSVAVYQAKELTPITEDNP